MILTQKIHVDVSLKETGEELPIHSSITLWFFLSLLSLVPLLILVSKGVYVVCTWVEVVFTVDCQEHLKENNYFLFILKWGQFILLIWVPGVTYAYIQCGEKAWEKQKTTNHQQKYRWQQDFQSSGDCSVIMFSGHQQWTDMETNDLSRWSLLAK